MRTRLNRLFLTGVVTVLMAGVGLVLPLAQINAVESEGLGAVPANPRKDNPRSNSIFVHTAKSGQTIHDAVKVVNNTGQAKTISLYAVDSQNSSDGAFACAQAADKRQGVGGWITISKPTVKLASYQNVEVPFTIKVPESVDAGEHNGCIVIQDSGQSASQKQGGVVLTFRSALRVAITIPGDLQAKLNLVSVEQKNDGKAIVMSPSYQNGGNVSLDTTIGVELKSILGQKLGSAGGQFPVLANSSAKFNFEVARPYWGGFYERAITTQYIKLSEQGQGVKAESLATNSEWVFLTPEPFALLVELIALALVATAGLVFWRRRKQHRELAASTVDYTVKKGDDIQSIAKAHHISWKTLTKVNKLKPPYSVKPGEVIQVPTKNKSKKKR